MKLNSMKLNRINTIMKHAWSEPKAVAQIEFWHEYPSLASQIFGAVPREELEGFVRGEGWREPDRVVSYVPPPPEPDWDWWEPRHDHPWRRQAARDRELDRLLAR